MTGLLIKNLTHQLNDTQTVPCAHVVEPRLEEILLLKCVEDVDEAEGPHSGQLVD
jgi:hypothetical protein